MGFIRIGKRLFINLSKKNIYVLRQHVSSNVVREKHFETNSESYVLRCTELLE